jgi:hypothetical protein
MFTLFTWGSFYKGRRGAFVTLRFLVYVSILNESKV